MLQPRPESRPSAAELCSWAADHAATLGARRLSPLGPLRASTSGEAAIGAAAKAGGEGETLREQARASSGRPPLALTGAKDACKGANSGSQRGRKGTDARKRGASGRVKSTLTLHKLVT